MERNVAHNFKGACRNNVDDGCLDAKYEEALHAVWKVMYGIQPPGGMYAK
jgi:hypothetical protein